jgi:hypothetical protein
MAMMALSYQENGGTALTIRRKSSDTFFATADGAARESKWRIAAVCDTLGVEP